MSKPKTIRTLLIYVAAIVAVGLPALVYILQSAADEESFGAVLRQTARLGLYIYLLIFILRPLQQLQTSKAGAQLLRNRRYLGVAFAGVMSVHLAFIIWFWFFVVGEAIPPLLLVGGGGAYLLLFLMLVTSFDGPAKAIGPRNWRRLHKVGLYWIGIIFVNTIMPDVIREPGNPFYLATAMLILVAIVLRLLAYSKRKPGTIQSP